MKIVIASDNHYNTKVLEQIEERHQQDADLFLHCGDSQLPYESPLMDPYLKVAGNCDRDRSYPDEELKNLITNDTLYMTHGHEHHVKSTMKPLERRAKELGATIACYGHSHCVDVYQENGLLVINPGSTFLPRDRKEKTYAVLTIEPTQYQVQILQVDTGKVLMEKLFEKGA